MGSCFSSRIKAGARKDLSLSTSKVSSSAGTVPTTLRTEGKILQATNLKSFTFGNLKAATRNFRPDSLLGEGGFECVFKGLVEENSLTAVRHGTGMVIAVKRLNQESYQGHQERLVVVDAAKGLAFLHSDKAKVIYRDFKTSNILLDSSNNAKLSDFGLAKDGPTGSKSHVSTRVMGTYGYAAPEYMATGHLTAKSDVCSFGVVLLEIISGRRAIDKNRPSREKSLVEWARPYLGSKQKIFQVMDARIEGHYTVSCALKVETLAVRCLSAEPKYRPNMEEVLRSLEQIYHECGSSNEGELSSRSREARADNGGKPRSKRTNGVHVVGQYTVSCALKVVTLAVRCLSAEPEYRPNMEEVLRSLEQIYHECSSSNNEGEVSSIPREARANNGGKPRSKRTNGVQVVGNGSSRAAPTSPRPSASPLRW
ncbi:unnamed protein product [Linum tenue]|uniref:Protein kinase domain-containing protein n=1 Tax=Linum tenue TaxID=586396 RepID=A0AAV0MBK1_9ROSI|nr:unnamed protein product [Linum tenue]